MSLEPGTRLGPYEILSPLGAGGMGEVYRARDTRLGRDVAVKVLPELLAADPDLRARFEREAKAVAALSHPNVLALFDYGSEGARTFTVTELLEGETLRQRMVEGELLPRKAVEWATQVARGLAAAHDRGVVHRDLKPENLFVTKDGVVKILDFGLARHGLGPSLVGEDTHSPTQARATEPGTLLGTVGYMSPEQVRGQETDGRSDIFSFGSVLYELLAGRRAFARDTAPETLTAILREEPQELPASLPAGLDRIVRHCLEKRREDRFGTAHDLVFALESLSGSSSASGAALPAAPSSTRWHRLAALVTAGSALAALGFAVGQRSAPVATSATALPSFRKLTDGASRKSEPSLAPDGKTFVYVSRESGNPDIYLQRVGGGNPINLTKDSPEADRQPAFSPDGDRIAFRSERQGGGVFVMGATGESVRRVTDSGNDPTWSPDGSEIVVAGDTTENVGARGGRDSSLWAIRVVDGSRRAVADSDAVEPAWSPSGRRVAYWGLRRPGSQRDLWTVAADGSEAKAPAAVTSDESLDWSPAWSPDGRLLYFASDRGGPLAIWKLAIDEETGRARSAAVGLGSPTPYTAGLSVARDGRTAVFEGRVIRQRLLVAALDAARGALASPPRAVHESSEGILETSVSTDGRHIAYRSQSRQGDDIWVLRSDGGERRMLTQDAFRDRGPCWSPDGQWIVFRSDREGGWGLWAIHPDGSGLKRIAMPGLVWSLAWSPREPVLAGYSGRSAVLVEWPTGSATARVRDLPDIEPGRALRPADWSADGGRLLGNSVRPGDQRPEGVYAWDARSGHYTRLLDRGLSASFWIDEERILGVAPDGLQVVDLRTKQARVLLPGQFDEVSVSADRRTLVAVEDLTASDIWLMALP